MLVITMFGEAAAAGLGALLVRRFAGGLGMLDRPRHLLVFALIAMAISAPIHATSELMADMLTGHADRVTGVGWAASWLVAVATYFTAAPAFVAWARWPSRRRREGLQRKRRKGGSRPSMQAAETAALMAATAAVTAWIALAPARPASPPNLWAFALFPLLGWAAVRLGAQETAAAVSFLNLGVFWREAYSAVPFGAGPQATIVVSALVALTTLTAFMLAASTEHRSQHQTRLHQLAVTDPLTGLANFRHLADAIERNIVRSQQRHEPFAVLLLDVDHLKTINDRDGHAAGSRLLVRLADHLRASFRSSDFLARHGGDEFAVVLPGCDQAAAEAQSARILDSLATDIEKPRISVSVGIAVFPRDGETAEELLEKSDQGLYVAKARRPISATTG